MRTRLLTPMLLAAAASLVCMPLVAGDRALEFDPATTHVTFDLAATGHDVHGTFGFERGRIAFDPQSGQASGEIVVDARAGESGNKKRDKTMHAKVLESEQFPQFVFVPQSFEGEYHESGPSTLRVHGTLQIHGESHPLTALAEVDVNGAQAAVEATFEIPFVEWGMHDPSILFMRVAKQVQITLSTRGTLDGSSADTTAAAVR